MENKIADDLKNERERRDAEPTRTTYITATTTIIGYQQFASLANKLVKCLIEKI